MYANSHIITLKNQTVCTRSFKLYSFFFIPSYLRVYCTQGKFCLTSLLSMQRQYDHQTMINFIKLVFLLLTLLFPHIFLFIILCMLLTTNTNYKTIFDRKKKILTKNISSKNLQSDSTPRHHLVGGRPPSLVLSPCVCTPQIRRYHSQFRLYESQQLKEVSSIHRTLNKSAGFWWILPQFRK